MKNHMLLAISFASLMFLSLKLSAQVGINADNSPPDPSAMLDVKSTTRGLLVPRMTQGQIALIAAPVNGLIVYCTTDNKFYAFVASANTWKEILYGPGFISPVALPALTTAAATNITSTTASCGGNITSDGGATVTVRGVCWSTSANPVITNSHSTDGGGTGVFTSSLTGLAGNTLYHVRAYATNSAGTAYGNEVTFSTTNGFTIGQNYGGGVIFYIDGTGQHGLISATSDQSAIATWGCNGNLIGGTSTAFNTGQANTTVIVNGCGQADIAARICYDLILNGYSDWFLPSKAELNEMFLQKNAIGGFSDAFYWSSSEYTDYFSWNRSFNPDQQGYGNKGAQFSVRAIRAF